MQEEKQKRPLVVKDLSLEERARIVGLFTWLIAQDKKQNPALYKLKPTQ